MIGKKIKQAREERRLSQDELGALFGCSGVNISRIEREVQGFDINDLPRLAAILGKTPEWFLSDNAVSPVRYPETALKDLEVAIHAYIPVYDEIMVSAGKGMEPIDFVAVTRSKAAPDSLRAYRVSGLCLEPAVIEGDTLIVDSDLSPVNGNLVICIINGKASVKRYRQDGEGKVWIENNNGSYRPEDCHIHGVVIELNRKVR